MTMNRILSLAMGLLIALTSTLTLAASQLQILGYHEITDKEQALIPQYAISPATFLAQMQWFKSNGYHFVSVDDVLADRAGKKPLPPKAVLLSFDDGYEDVYSQVFPILKQFNAPAQIALVGSWLEPQDGMVNFAGQAVPRSRFLSQSQIREMVKSGLVEVASHTYGLHEGVVANPQGNTQPAATTRIFRDGRYETEKEYRARVAADLRHNNAFLRRYTGQTPRIMVWPYGSYNQSLVEIAAKLGLVVDLTLDDGPNTGRIALTGLRRILLESDTSLSDLATDLALRAGPHEIITLPGKIMHVAIDDIYDPDPDRQNQNLGNLLERIVASGVNTVYLKAFADHDGNGTADAVYFPSRRLPMRADLLNRVVWQIKTRTSVQAVYAWGPLLVSAAASGSVERPAAVTARLSPFTARGRQLLRQLYEEMALAGPIDGLLFSEEPASGDAASGRQEPGMTGQWDRFALELAAIVRREHPDLKTARTLYRAPLLSTQGANQYAQAFRQMLSSYDFTVAAVAPAEDGCVPERALHEVVRLAANHPGGLTKTVFDLAAPGCDRFATLPGEPMAKTVSQLYSRGVQHIAFYPAPLAGDQQATAALAQVFAIKGNMIGAKPRATVTQ
ncbi:poly-beta-1,6-N-acetyl-D-glucosamine N-deacetylase PgaB [Pseudogulbenkiania sp. NH8B]|uniref:poly-beta-1,6-N-acetyl-D-glucosamine N-deacetylase PgaB n=1 Tax=Pseudogulbenkiania sp. (strain NH8B) TaxID=748280 RepID=UPI0002FF8C62|nr:poly-beta-1,6-N-acetyl-D-glucosamine N-deacetylase PgaB [Pseudogulbenkiania sp. NH8B]